MAGDVNIYIAAIASLISWATTTKWRQSGELCLKDLMSELDHDFAYGVASVFLVPDLNGTAIYNPQWPAACNDLIYGGPFKSQDHNLYRCCHRNGCCTTGVSVLRCIYSAA